MLVVQFWGLGPPSSYRAPAMYSPRVYLLMLALLCREGVVQSWSASEYWNSRYSSKGISYPSEETYQGMWSDSSSYSDNLYFSSGTYSGSSCSCACDEKENIVTGCSSSSITLKNYAFHNITHETFSSSVQEVSILLVSVFTLIGENTFKDVTDLQTLVIHKTGLKNIPDLSTTSAEKVMLGKNDIQFFINNHTNYGWPSTLTHLVLSDNSIAWVPPGLFSNSNIKYLSLSRNSIEFFPADALHNMPNLEYLSLSENLITSINIGHLAPLSFGLSNLIHLNVSNNKIFWVQPYALTTLTSLKILELHDNEFETITPGQFHNVSQLLHLDLSHNKLTILSGDSFTELQNLVSLRLHSQSSGLTNIYYDAFYNINDNLENIWVSSNILTTFPHQVLSEQNYSSLWEVHADFNSITDPIWYGRDGLPGNVNNLYDVKFTAFKKWISTPNIGFLKLGNNLIPDLSEDEFCELTHLTTLYLDNNLLDDDTVPEDAFNCLPELSILDLSYNVFQYSPKAVKSSDNLPSITVLYLNNNQITFVSEGDYSEHDQLTTLTLNYNNIVTLENGTFPTTSLTSLDLSSNNIKLTHSEVFHGMANLLNLNLGSNNIDILPSYIFRGCTSLVNIYLDNNQIGRLEPSIFEDQPAAMSVLSLSYNNIGFIEDGTFDHFTYIGILNLQNNELTSLPRGGDFHDITIGNSLYLSNNRITRIETGTFRSMSVSGNLDLTTNRISDIESGAFVSVTCSSSLYLTSNFLRDIHSEAFTDVSASNIFASNMFVTHLPARAFNGVTTSNLDLTYNQIAYIDQKAFDVSVSNNLDLRYNNLVLLNGQLFKTGSYVRNLHMGNNDIRVMPTDAFVGLTVNDAYFSNNQLFIFPDALLVLDLGEVWLENNFIEEIPSGTFDGQTQMVEIHLKNNLLSTIPSGVLDPLTGLQELDFSYNSFAVFDVDELNQLTSLETLLLNDNDIFSIGKLPELLNLEKVDLSSNIIKSFAVNFTGSLDFSVLSYLDLSDNNLGCDCHLYGSLVQVESSINGGECSTPNASPNLSGSLLAWASKKDVSYFQKVDSEDFLCSPVDVTGNIPADQTIELTWSDPELESWEGPLLTAAIEYEVECVSDSAADVSTTTSSTTVTFDTDDGVVGEVRYACYVYIKNTTSGTKTAGSLPAIVTTTAPEAPAVVAAPDDIVLPITYYDFSVAHDDFNNIDEETFTKPSYVPSPYGAWLSISSDPSQDSFSDWYRKINTNYQFERTILLKGYSDDVPFNRFNSTDFFPLDGLGYGEERQSDCNGDNHNFGFTSAIRTGIVYQGNETITVGGGDEVWLFVNRKLAIEINNVGASSSQCQQIDLSPALPEGGGLITPEVGVIVGNKCVLTTTASNSLQLDLDVGERYHFTVFHTERFLCKSSFFMESVSAYFITDPVEEPPRDYLVKHDEDYHLGGIIETIYLADSFSKGPPFTVRLLKGNEARHFTVQNDTTSNRLDAVAPDPPEYNYTTIGNVSFVECAGPAVLIPESNETSVEEFYLTTSTMLVTLNAEVDFEVETYYTMVFEIVDLLASPPLSGQATLKVKIRDVNDNCPILVERDYYYWANPSLQLESVIKIMASDEDSTSNALLYFQRNDITLSPLFYYNNTMDLYNEVYTKNTNLSCMVLVTDGGTPTRGTYASVTVELHNTCVVDTQFLEIDVDIVVDSSVGDTFIRIPGLYQESSECYRKFGLSSGHIPDTWLDASSASYGGDASQARLNGTRDTYGDFAGGWVPSFNDLNQWIQLDMQVPTVFRELQIQGRQDAEMWVETFSLIYSDDGSSWQTYNSTDGNTIFDGNFDQDNTTVLVLVPFIYARYVRIIPLTWHVAISLRFEMYGCSQEEKHYDEISCKMCDTTWFCPGDGTLQACGRCNPPKDNSTCGHHPTEHSFGRASRCATCIEGWLCHDGYGTPCAAGSYSKCNATWCPDECTPCEPGYACRGGLRYMCEVGQVSPGEIEYCVMCEAGTFVNETAQSNCTNCSAGFSSSKGKDGCTPCSSGAYSSGDGGTCQVCSDAVQCPCMERHHPCFIGNNSESTCVNVVAGGVHTYQCLGCPVGYEGDGQDCTDIDECTVYSPCWQSICTNTAPGYQCPDCPLGYEGLYEDGMGHTVNVRTFEDACIGEHGVVIYQTCEDVNECDTNNGGCDPNAYCHNSLGSYACGICKDGYVGSSFYGCKPGNYCASAAHDCDDNALCIYTGPAQYTCECVNGWAGNGKMCGVDPDQDGIPTEPLSCVEYACRRDNCPEVSNSGQEDNDKDWEGDVCDPDDDNDSIYDFMDNCPYVYNIGQMDSDGDGVGDACDNCLSTTNTDQKDTNNDGSGDQCDSDMDGDGITNGADVCQEVADPAQTDSDGDGVGDSCDNCPNLSNSGQIDTNENGIGDDCEDWDSDGDGIINSADNCETSPNSLQADTDGDGLGDLCDDDIDGDGVLNDNDNCPYVVNANQADDNGNHIGDACDKDFDGDGTVDTLDICPSNPTINRTNFFDYDSIRLYPGSNETDPEWLILYDGLEIRQAKDTDVAALIVGAHYLEAVEYVGTMFVYSDVCTGYIGFVFGYQNNAKFYAVIWRHQNYNYGGTAYRAGIKGLQIKLVNSATGPSQTMAHAMWHSQDTTDEVKVLYHDTELLGWECKTAYNWQLIHQPSRGAIRVIIKQEEDVLVDTGEIYDTTITGGRVGMLVFQQPGAIFSKLNYKCRDRDNSALKFDGNDYLTLDHVPEMRINNSFTLESWVYLEAGYSQSKMPVFCTQSSSMCMYIESGLLHGRLGGNYVNASTPIPEETWTLLIMRYNLEEQQLSLWVDGAIEVLLTEAAPYSWPNETMYNESDSMLYIGTDMTYFLNGTLDEVRIYSVFVYDDELDEHYESAGLFWSDHKRYLSVHYNMDNNVNTSQLQYPEYVEDKSWRMLNGLISGDPQFVASRLDEARFSLAYSKKRRRKRSVEVADDRAQDRIPRLYDISTKQHLTFEDHLQVYHNGSRPHKPLFAKRLDVDGEKESTHQEL